MRAPVEKPRGWIPWFMLTISLLSTALVGLFLHRSTLEKDTARFEAEAMRAITAVTDRLSGYTSLLRAEAGMFAASEYFSASEYITVNEFHAFAERLILNKNYPGLQGIGFALRVAPEEAAQVTAVLRQTTHPNFTIWPAGDRPVFFPIVYLEPMDERNRAAIGYDMFSDPVRNAAMSRARDEGVAAASGQVVLVQEITRRKQNGFLIYVPVYEGYLVPETFEERREKLRGFAFCPLRADDFLFAIFSANPPPVTVEIYDGDSPAPGAKPMSSFGKAPAGYHPRFETRKAGEYAGARWTFEIESLPDFEATSNRYIVTYFLSIGGLVSFLIFALSLRQVEATRGAVRAAAELAESEAWMKFLSDASVSLASSLNLEEILANVVKLTIESQADWAHIDLLEEDGTIRRVALNHRRPERIRELMDTSPAIRDYIQKPRKDALAMQLSRGGRGMLFPELTDELIDRTMPDPTGRATLRALETKSIMLTPLMSAGQVIGVIVWARSESNRPYTAEDLARAEEIARRAAVAIQNAQLFEKSQRAETDARRAAEELAESESWMKFLSNVSAALAGSLSLEDTLGKIGSLMVEWQADWGSIDLIEPDGSLRRVGVHFRRPEQLEALLKLDDEIKKAIYNPEPDSVVAVVARSGKSKLYPVVTDEIIDQEDPDPARRRLYRALEPVSGMITPMMASGRDIGVISWGLSAASGRHYTPQDLERAEEFARRAAFAVQNALLYEQAQREIENRKRAEAQALQAAEDLAKSEAWMKFLSDAGVTLASSLDLVETVRKIAGLIVGNQADFCGIDLLKPDGALERMIFLHRSPEKISAMDEDTRDYLLRPNREALVKQVCDAQRSVLFPVVNEEIITGGTPDRVRRRMFRQLEIKSGMVTPLLISGECIGAISWGRAEPSPTYSAEDLGRAEEFARRAAVAIQNARLYDQSQRAESGALKAAAELAESEASMKFLSEASAVLAGSLDTKQTLKQVAAMVTQSLADWCEVDLLGEDGNIQRLIVTHRDPAKESAARDLMRFPINLDETFGVARALRKGSSVVYPEVTDELLDETIPDPERRATLKRLGTRSIMTAPVMIFGEALGAITWVGSESGRYAEDDVRLAENLAGRAAVAIQNARLYEQAQREIESRKRAQEELRELNQNLEVIVRERTRMAEDRARQLKFLAHELTQAEQAERKRISQILHDDLQQILVAARLKLGSIRLHSEFQPRIEEAQDLISQAISSARNLNIELSPPVLQDRGLGAALEWLARKMQQSHDFNVELFIDPAAEPRSYDLKAFLLQSAREALFNVIKHAGVDTARVELRLLDESSICLTVSDQGRGCDPQELLSTISADHFGLFNIKHRIELLGGSFIVESGPGRGCTVKLCAPLNVESEDSSSSADYKSPPKNR